MVEAANSTSRRPKLVEARTVVAGNALAEAVVRRAEALLAGDQRALLATADAFGAAATSPRERRCSPVAPIPPAA
ncbi:hypothetical protein GA0070213_102353 [Micromonospora humi]|uniref:Uncharacterized protein n=2 Tax=Micromonospora humi TaxID=745366 RepID=A0A1C5H6C4_9ACTN|nr:hypothetical protein GA0070213_102353 [Micromonospora humi]